MRKDPVTTEVRLAVLRRDKMCFLFMLDGESHVCKDQWGNTHPAYDQHLLTLDHVHDVAGGIKGLRAKSDEAHMVAMCARANIDGPSRRVRIAERRYLKEITDHGNTSLAVLRAIVEANEYMTETR